MISMAANGSRRLHATRTQHVEAKLQARDRSEIVDEIVEQLGCNPATRPEVARAINGSFEYFRCYDGLFAREGKAAMVASAKAVAEHILALGSELKTAPALLRDFLFTPPQWRSAATAADVDAYLAAKTTYEEMVLELLRTMRFDCEKFLADEANEPLRPGPEKDRAQRHCARLAYILMTRFSSRPISGTAEGPFHRAASLLYEAMRGRPDVDLKRHCDAVLKAPPI